MRGIRMGVLAVGLALGCAAPSGSVEVVRLDALEELREDESLWLDLTDPERAYIVAADVPRDRLTLVCPNGVAMRGDDWAAANPEAAPEHMALALSASGELAEQASDACRTVCITCTDGVTSCRLRGDCLDESVAVEIRPTPEGRGEDEPSSGAPSPRSEGGSSGSGSGGSAPSGGSTPGARPAG